MAKLTAESAPEDIEFDDSIWERIFSETNTFLKGIHILRKEDISVDINTANSRCFLEVKSSDVSWISGAYAGFSEQMDAELIRIPFFSTNFGRSFL